MPSEAKSEGNCERWAGIDICVGHRVRVVLSWRPAVIVEGEVLHVSKTSIVVRQGREVHAIVWREVKLLTVIAE